MITTPLDILTTEFAEQVFPGCLYQFAAEEEQNTAADKAAPDTSPDQGIFFVDDRMPVSYKVAGNGKLTITYTVTVLLLRTSKPTDSAPVRWPRVKECIEVGGRLLLTLQGLMQLDNRPIQAVRQIGAEILYNHFDRNADGVALTYEIVPADTYTYC